MYAIEDVFLACASIELDVQIGELNDGMHGWNGASRYMDQQSTDVVLRRIDQAGTRGIAAFDADGTLWAGDIGDDLFHVMLDDDAWLEPTHHALVTEAELAHITPESSAGETVRALLAACQRGAYPEERLLEVVAWGLAGRSRTAVDAYVRDVLTRSRALERLQNETVTVLRALQQRGIVVYVVSASPREIVEAAVSSLGIDAQHVVAASAVYDSGHMLARVHRPISYGQGKVHGLRALAGDAPLLAAFGDNYFDAEMLRAARVPVAVRPKPGLRRIAESIPGLVELVSAP